MVVDADHSTTALPPEFGPGEDANVPPTVVEEVGVDLDDLIPVVERRLRDGEPDVDRHISMGSDMPSDVEQSSGLDRSQKDIDKNDEPNPGSGVEDKPTVGALGGENSGNIQRSFPALSQTGNSAASPPTAFDPPYYPDIDPHDEDTDADADADADEDVDAEGEADADGDVDLDAEGDVDLGAESTFSGLASGALFMDIGVIPPAEYPLSSPSLPSGLLDAQNDKAQLYCANGISRPEDVLSNPTLTDKQLPGDRHS
jgi:hypothetical protein